VDATAPKSDNDEPAAEIARRVARELRDLCAVAAKIECAVGGLLLIAGGGGAHNHRDLQALDALAQSLYGLAQFLDQTAEHMPQEWQFDPMPAAAALKLRDLAARLAPAAEPVAKSQVADKGDCLFL